MKKLFLFSILIIIKLILNKDFSNINNNTKNSTNDSNRIEQLKKRGKRIACLNLIRKSLENKTSELKLFLQEHKNSYFSYFKKITDYCKDKISEEQAEIILTKNNVTLNETFNELIFNDYIKNLKLDDDFVDKKEKKVEKKEKKKEKKEKKEKKKKDKKSNKKKKKIEKIIKISAIAILTMVLLLLIVFFFMFKSKPKIISKEKIENLNQKNKKKKTE